MIRIEYIIYGKFWNHISTDFQSIKSANKYVENEEMKSYASQIKFLHIEKEEIFIIKPDETFTSNKDVRKELSL